MILARAVLAETWKLTAAAQRPGKGPEAVAVVPDEIWTELIDGMTSKFATDELHTVTFLTPDALTRISSALPGAKLRWNQLKWPPKFLRPQRPSPPSEQPTSATRLL